MLTINNVGEIVQVNKSGLIVATDAASNIKGFVLRTIDGEYYLIKSINDEWGETYFSLEDLIEDYSSDYKFKFISND